MNFRHILSEKKTSIAGLLIGLSTLCKTMNLITEEQNGAIISVLPDFVNFAIMAYLMLSKDGK